MVNNLTGDKGNRDGAGSCPGKLRPNGTETASCHPREDRGVHRHGDKPTVRVSRRTAHKRIGRFDDEGIVRLADRHRAPKNSPQKTAGTEDHRRHSQAGRAFWHWGGRDARGPTMMPARGGGGMARFGLEKALIPAAIASKSQYRAFRGREALLDRYRLRRLSYTNER